MNNLCNRILTILDLKGISQNKLAEMIGMAPGQISRIIKGVNIPRVDTALRISRALGFPLDKVFLINEFKEEKNAVKEKTNETIVSNREDAEGETCENEC